MSKLPEPPAREITPEPVYLRRREWLKQAGLFVGASAAWGAGLVGLSSRGSADPPPPAPEPPPIPSARPDGKGGWRIVARGRYTVDEAQTPYEDVTTYNNFYELGTSKADPAKNAATLRARPWTVAIDGEVHERRTIDIDTLFDWFGLEERVYRMRCVEAWSMVIPWVGIPLAALIKRLEPTSQAKYVAFETLLDPEQLPEQRSKEVLPWPYVEGLRMDEAVNELALLAVGVYGRPLPGQNGAPLRLVVPWKYGFKGIKSIVKISFVREQPRATWNYVEAEEYGFYANVNPEVDHPRWSQKTERRIGELTRRPTLPFNGYGAEVAHLYSGMDLRKHF